MEIVELKNSNEQYILSALRLYTKMQVDITGAVPTVIDSMLMFNNEYIDGVIFIALDGNHLLGICSGIPIDDNKFYVSSLYAEHSEQRAQVVKELAEAIMLYARDKTLVCNTYNNECSSLVESLGFKRKFSVYEKGVL